MSGRRTQYAPGRRSAVVLLTLFATAGCGDGLKLVHVSGTVTLDGSPLQGARVEFQPQGSRPSWGVTDSQGHYSLRYTPEKLGAVPGEHAVSITTAVSTDDDSRPSKELLPARYNVKSSLKATVDSDHRTHDFALESK